MSTSPNWLLSEAVTRALGGSTTQLANIREGAQLGYGVNLPMLDAATPQVFPPTVCLVLTAPQMYAENMEMVFLLKALIESHSKTITGIDFGYTLNTDEGPAGHDGQTIKVPTKTRRSDINPSITFNELTGNLVWRVMRKWVFDTQHPDTYYGRTVGTNPRGSSTYSMSMLAIQFDPSGLAENILGAAYITNMFPTDIGQFGMEKNVGQARAMERTIQFAGLVMENEAVYEMARLVAANISAAMVNYNNLNNRNVLSGGAAEAVERHGMISGGGGIMYEAARANGMAANV